MKQRIDRTLLMWLVALVVLAGILHYPVWAGADVDPSFWKEGVSNVHSATELTLLTLMQPDARDLKFDFEGLEQLVVVWIYLYFQQLPELSY